MLRMLSAPEPREVRPSSCSARQHLDDVSAPISRICRLARVVTSRVAAAPAPRPCRRAPRICGARQDAAGNAQPQHERVLRRRDVEEAVELEAKDVARPADALAACACASSLSQMSSGFSSRLSRSSLVISSSSKPNHFSGTAAATCRRGIRAGRARRDAAGEYAGSRQAGGEALAGIPSARASARRRRSAASSTLMSMHRASGRGAGRARRGARADGPRAVGRSRAPGR